MSDLRNPFAVRDDKLILIEDLTLAERGLKCRCYCPACGGEFMARMGKIKVHHFSHTKDACDEVIAYTTGLYRMLLQVLSEATCGFYVPALAVRYNLPRGVLLDMGSIGRFVSIIREVQEDFDDPFDDENYYDYGDDVTQKVISQGRHITFDSAVLAYNSKHHIEAIELSCKGKTMAVKVMPPDTVCKVGAVSPHKDMATLVLDFADDGERIQGANTASFREYLLSDKLYKYWVSNPRVADIYPALLERNKRDYEKHLAEQEERRIAEEKRKAEVLERHKQLEAEKKTKEELKRRQAEAEAQLLTAYFERKQRNNPSNDSVAEVFDAESLSEADKRYIIQYESVWEKFGQGDDSVRDCDGYRWFVCEFCGEIKPESGFWSYWKTTGKCYECRDRGLM